MASKSHLISKYNYSFDAHTGTVGTLQLWGQSGKLGEVRFVGDSAAVPAPVLYPNLSGADMCFKLSTLPVLIDMLRNVSPVALTVNDQGSGFAFLRTDPELVGEGEAKTG